MAWPTLGSSTAKEQNRTNQNYVMTVLAKIPQTNNRNTYTMFHSTDKTRVKTAALH